MEDVVPTIPPAVTVTINGANWDVIHSVQIVNERLAMSAIDSIRAIPMSMYQVWFLVVWDEPVEPPNVLLIVVSSDRGKDSKNETEKIIGIKEEMVTHKVIFEATP